jgi:CDP-diacylglycerol--serine O-phosphatidyltransferase
MLCGIIAIFFCLKLELLLASAFILLGILMDAFDGRIARKLGVFSEIGAKLDSKADFMTFGIAPAVFIFAYLSSYSSFWFQAMGLGLGIIFYVSVHFRLRRFDSNGGHSDYFQGLPSPIGAALVVTAFSSSVLSGLFIFIPVILISSILMVSTLSYPHNSIAGRLIFYRFLPIPTLIVWSMVILQLFGIKFPISWHLPDILFVFMVLYLMSPWIFKRDKT